MRRAGLGLLAAAGLVLAPAAGAAPTTTTTPVTTPAPPGTAATTTAPAPSGPAAPPPTSPTITPATGRTAPTAPTTTVPAGPPRLSSLRLPRVVTATQGHAQFLVGARLSAPARLTVQVTSVTTKAVVKTVTEQTAHPAGREYLLVAATNDQGYQIPATVYRVQVQATDARGRQSNVLKGSFRLKLTPPRGHLDASTVPLWPAFARLIGLPAGGQLVAAVAPSGAAFKAGIRRGDVITAINGKRTDTVGELPTALRALPANKAVPVEVQRNGQARSFSLTAPPDWQPAADLSRALAVVRRRQPGVFAYAYAQTRERLDAGKPDEATTLLNGWPPSWRASAIGQMLQGDLLTANRQTKQALAAYNRALAADPTLDQARFDRALALSALGKDQQAAQALAKVAADDPNDALAAAYQAYLLVKLNRLDEAVASADQAIALDPGYEDGYAAKGLALLAKGQRAQGLRLLKQGIVLLSDPTRAQQLITANLEPSDP
jgi:hypothetical protein